MTAAQMFNATFDVWSALFCSILMVGTYASRSYDPRQARWLLCSLATNAAVSIAEVFAYLFRGDASAMGFYAVRISNFLVFAGNHFLLFFFAQYVFHTIETHGGRVGALPRRILLGALSLGAMLLVLSRPLGFYYAFDAQNRYYRLRSYFVMVGLQALALLVIVSLTVANWKSLSFLEHVSFAVFEFAPLIATAAQVFSYGLSLTTMVNTVAIALVFVTYEIEYSRHTLMRERVVSEQIIEALAQAVDARDTYTSGHSARVARYARMLAERMGLEEDEVERIYRMAVLHDVGKIGIPDNVLNKEGKLTDEEFDVIKSHTKRGYFILAGVDTLPELRMAARWHHERYDGRGYPDGLAGEDIPLEARIICVADSYDAMTSDRVYRDHLPQDVVRSEIERGAGSQFDPEVARVMLQIMSEDTDYMLHE